MVVGKPKPEYPRLWIVEKHRLSDRARTLNGQMKDVTAAANTRLRQVEREMHPNLLYHHTETEILHHAYRTSLSSAGPPSLMTPTNTPPEMAKAKVRPKPFFRHPNNANGSARISFWKGAGPSRTPHAPSTVAAG